MSSYRENSLSNTNNQNKGFFSKVLRNLSNTNLNIFIPKIYYQSFYDDFKHFMQASSGASSSKKRRCHIV